MKTLLSLATGLLLNGITFSQAPQVTVNVQHLFCKELLAITVTHNLPYKVKVWSTTPNANGYYPVIFNPSNLFPPTYTNNNPLLVGTSSVGQTYKVEVYDLTNWISPLIFVNVPSTCRYRIIDMGPGPIVNGRTVAPADPEEAGLTDMDVRWKLEEIDPVTWEPLFTIDNPVCWGACNVAGASNSFNGFNGFDASSVSSLQAGNCSPEPGTFDPEKIYRVTRTHKSPDDDYWVEYSVYTGPGTEQEGEARSMFFDNTILSVDLFTLAQDHDQEIVTFNTTVDEGKLVIFDATGHLVSPITLSAETFAYELNTAVLAKGLYVAHLQSGSGVTIKKFLVD